MRGDPGGVDWTAGTTTPKLLIEIQPFLLTCHAIMRIAGAGGIVQVCELCEQTQSTKYYSVKGRYGSLLSLWRARLSERRTPNPSPGRKPYASYSLPDALSR